MRKHGVSGYPDPQVTTNPDGSVAMAIAGPANASAAPAFRSAQKACSGILLAQSSINGHSGPSRQEFLAFAHCLHTHGILDFPDPNTQGQITGQMINASGVDLKARVLHDRSRRLRRRHARSHHPGKRRPAGQRTALSASGVPHTLPSRPIRMAPDRAPARPATLDGAGTLCRLRRARAPHADRCSACTRRSGALRSRCGPSRLPCDGQRRRGELRAAATAD